MSMHWITQQCVTAAAITAAAFGQEPNQAGDWKTWVIESGEQHGVASPPGAVQTLDMNRSEIELAADAEYDYDYRVVLGDDYNPCRPQLYTPDAFDQ